MDTGKEMSKQMTGKAGSEGGCFLCSDERPGNAARSRFHQISSDDLFRGKSELRILHDGSEYCLRITRQNKLILTK